MRVKRWVGWVRWGGADRAGLEVGVGVGGRRGYLECLF